MNDEEWEAIEIMRAVILSIAVLVAVLVIGLLNANSRIDRLEQVHGTEWRKR